MTLQTFMGVALVAVSLLTGFGVAEGPGAAVGGVAGIALHQLAGAVLRALTAAVAWLETDRKARTELAQILADVRDDLRAIKRAMRLEEGQ